MMVVGDALVGSGKGTLVLWAAVNSSTGWFSPRLQLLQLGGKWYFLMRLLLSLLLKGFPSALYERVFNLQIFRQTIRVDSGVNKVKRTRLKTREQVLSQFSDSLQLTLILSGFSFQEMKVKSV